MPNEDSFVEDSFIPDEQAQPKQSIGQSAAENIFQGVSGINTMLGQGLSDWVNVLNPTEKNTLYRFYKGLEAEHKKGTLASGAIETAKSMVAPTIERAADVSGKLVTGDISGAAETVARKPFDYLMDATLFYSPSKSIAEKGGKTASEGMSKLSENAINSIIKPRDRQFSYGKNPGRGVANEGIIATSMGDLADKVSAKRTELGQAIGSEVSKLGKLKQNYSAIIKPIDEAIAQVAKDPRSNSGVIQRLNNHKYDIMGAIEDDKGVITGYKYDLAKMTPKEAYEIKKRIGDNTKWTGAASDDALVNKTLKQVYGKIDSKLDVISPKLKSLNERFADILGADIAIKHREGIANRADMLGLMGGVAGGLGGELLGSTPGAIGGGALFYKIAASTPAKTIMAQALKNGASFSEAVSLAAKKLPKLPKGTTPTILGINANQQK